ncbi:MAG: FAD-binding oxidoreductase [Pseudomonadota bacterium]
MESARQAFDVVIVGGAMMGSSAAWFLVDNPEFDGTILVVERDPSYANSSTARTNSCMRQQFSNPLNIQISQFAAEYVTSFRERMTPHFDRPDEAPQPVLQSFGYMYFAADTAAADVLRANHEVQASCGAGTRLMTPNEVAAAFPFYALDDIELASHNPVNEGYFDGNTLFDTWRTLARKHGATFVQAEVVGLELDGPRVARVALADGRAVACGTFVNAAGPRADVVARMAGIEIPVEPRKRFTFIFDAAEPLDRDLPLTIDPSGVHVRTDGRYYLAGCPPDVDTPCAFDDLEMDPDVWEEKAWPAIAARIPAFERVKVVNEWAGHYAFNTLDQNAIVGRHPEITNFVFMNGFSGHGFQQSPAIGRGVAELIAYGEYRSLDLAPLGFERIAAGVPFTERAVI